MFHTELRRMLRSKSTWGIFLIFLVGIIASAEYWGDKQLLIHTYMYDGSQDLDIAKLEYLIDNYTGWKFMLKMFSSPDYAALESVLVLAWIGIFVSPSFDENRLNANGNMILSRISYRRYLFSSITAQSVYIFLVVAAGTMTQTVLACIIGGFDIPVYSIGDASYEGLSVVLLVIMQMILFSFYLVLANICTVLLSMWIDNKFVVYMIPVMIFYIIPFMLASTVGNIFIGVGNALVYVYAATSFTNVNSVLQAQYSSEPSWMYFSSYVLLIIAAIWLCYCNIKCSERNYL